MFEHMAFKGTETIGTKDWPAEKEGARGSRRGLRPLDAERNKGPKADQRKSTCCRPN